MAERSKARAWKARVPERVPWVRIPLSPPFSLPFQRISRPKPITAAKFSLFRGVLAVEPWCIRTGDCGFRAWKTPQPLFFSVAKLGGSVSPGWVSGVQKAAR